MLMAASIFEEFPEMMAIIEVGVRSPVFPLEVFDDLKGLRALEVASEKFQFADLHDDL